MRLVACNLVLMPVREGVLVHLVYQNLVYLGHLADSLVRRLLENDGGKETELG